MTDKSPRTLALVSVGTVLLGAMLVAGAGPARADTTPTTNQNQYSLSAEGDGLYNEVADNSLPATTDTAASPYSSQASLDSDENSTAFAGLPYLGPVAETIGGTVNGLSGGATPPIPPGAWLCDQQLSPGQDRHRGAGSLSAPGQQQRV